MKTKKNKKIISKVIFSKLLGTYEKAPLTLRDLPDDIKETDEIFIEYNDGYYSENNSWNPFTKLHVFRDLEETDDEYNTRIVEEDRTKQLAKQKRYNLYLELKKEFEGEG